MDCCLDGDGDGNESQTGARGHFRTQLTRLHKLFSHSRLYQFYLLRAEQRVTAFDAATDCSQVPTSRMREADRHLVDQSYAPPMSRTGVDLGEPYRISPRRWLMLDRKGRICPGGPPIWEIKSIVWLGFCGSNPEPEEARASSCQQPTCALRHPPSTVQTRPGSCPLVLRHARTHARTHSHATDAGAREDHRLGGQLGTHAPPTNLAPLN